MASLFDLNGKRKDKKEEEEGCSAMYSKWEKSSVLQEARMFNQNTPPPKKCIQVLTKLLNVLQHDNKLSKNEATETFFAMTKLFQYNDQNLRLMLYIVLKELSSLSDDVIIVTSSLTKDMTGPEPAFRAPAIRALCTITDATLIQSIERYLKQAIVDKSPTISSAVLTSAYKLIDTCPDVIKRWTSEIQESVTSSQPMVQYHALGLLYAIRRSDRLATVKMVQKLTRTGLRSPYAYCLMIRIVSAQLKEEGLANNQALLDFLQLSIRHKSEMVIYEATRAVINLPELTAKELDHAISVLQLLSCSQKPAYRYAAVRTLNVVATKHPTAVTACNLELEQLIGDSNRSIATLAITTLLKTGSESNVERLLKHVNPFMSEITDEFKIVVLDSIQALAMKYPKKYTVLLNFLCGLLRDSAGYKFKKAVVETIEVIIKQIPEAKSIGLMQLCEFIEDCEHVKLTQRILYLLGREGPFLKRSRQFTRYIYNRVMLEAAPVKCTATTALARFAAHNQELLPSIIILLKRIMVDEDDEVRDRAAFYHYILTTDHPDLKSAYLLNEEMHLSPSGLEHALLNYVQDSANASANPFSLSTVPIAEPVPTTNVSISGAESSFKEDSATAQPKNAADAERNTKRSKVQPQESYAEQLASIPQFKKLGPLFKSSKPVELTEPDTEYVVTCIKHVFLKHLILQFDCTNTMFDHVLNDVYVECESEDPDFVIIETVPCSTLKYNCPGAIYVLVELPEDLETYSTTFMNTLRFKVKSVEDESSNPGLSDDYQLEELNFGISDHIQRVPKSNFSLAWEELSEDTELEETYMLTKCKTIKETMHQIIDHLGMYPCDRSDHMATENKSTHQLTLSGVFRGGYSVLAYCKLAKLTDQGVTFQIKTRSSDPSISRLVVDAVG